MSWVDTCSLWPTLASHMEDLTFTGCPVSSIRSDPPSPSSCTLHTTLGSHAPLTLAPLPPVSCETPPPPSVCGKARYTTYCCCCCCCCRHPSLLLLLLSIASWATVVAEVTRMRVCLVYPSCLDSLPSPTACLLLLLAFTGIHVYYK